MERPEAVAAGSLGRDELTGERRRNKSKPQEIRYSETGFSWKRIRSIVTGTIDGKQYGDLGWPKLKHHAYNGKHRDAQSLIVKEFARSAESEGRAGSKGFELSQTPGGDATSKHTSLERLYSPANQLGTDGVRGR
jgi:hypothetical protein